MARGSNWKPTNPVIIVCDHVFTDHPAWGLVDVYVANLPDLKFTPALHVHYQESVLPIKDGLPKMKDMPAEMGGSGETLSE